jgi:ketosteroid isomerase-like protein
MSQENVGMVYQAIDAFNRRDLDGFLALMDPDVEFTPYEVAVQGGRPYRGHDGVRTWWEESFAVLPDLRAEIDEVRDGGDRVSCAGAFARTAQAAARPLSARCCWP